MVLTVLVLVFFFGLLALYCYRRFWAHKFFERLGVPGPRPNWLLGNMKDFAADGTRHLVIAEWTKRYGKMYGYFEGPKPTLVISDVNMVRQVFVRQFPTFHGRKLYPLQPNPDTDEDGVHMLLLRGQKWKRIRTIINPTFSSAKLRAMVPIMLKCLAEFEKVIDQRASSNRAFDILECFKFLSMDTIMECAFGVDLGSARTEGKGNPILDNINKIFEYTFKVPPVVVVAMLFPELSPLLSACVQGYSKVFGYGYHDPVNKLLQMADSIIKTRKSNPSTRRVDMLQIMIELENEKNDQNSMKSLSIDEIKAQAFIFMAAGYETSSNALGFASFFLAKNPRVQEKLYKEILQHFPDKTVEANYDSVFALKYLDCVINETLRMYPVGALVVNRLAMEETELSGVHIPAGLPVQVDVWSIHYDNDIFGPVDTSIFYPERFSEDYPSNPDRDMASFLAFGCGPRICIGLRFAMLELKLALVRVLQKYRIEETVETGDSLELNVAASITPKNGVWVKLTPR